MTECAVMILNRDECLESWRTTSPFIGPIDIAPEPEELLRINNGLWLKSTIRLTPASSWSCSGPPQCFVATYTFNRLPTNNTNELPGILENATTAMLLQDVIDLWCYLSTGRRKWHIAHPWDV